MKKIMKKRKKKTPTVVLVGRVNVGKSSLFNTLTETKRAIVSDIAGTTRDRQYGEVFWRGQKITLVDIAGLDVEDPELIDQQSLEQAEKAIREADLILFLVDVRAGLLPDDKTFEKKLRIKNKDNIVLVANKADSIKYDPNLQEFFKLGLGEAIPVSAANGRGTGDLLDIIWEKLNLTEKEQQTAAKERKKIQIGLIGKPNVGKSSIFNVIAGEERVIVNEKPHTTRDRQFIDINYKAKSGKTYHLQFIDTAGVKKKGKVKGALEKIGIQQSIQTIKEADIILFVTDCSQRITVSDKNLTNLILDLHPSFIIVANKWDLIPEKDEKTQKNYIEYYKKSFPYLSWAPIIFISAKSGFKLSKLLEMIAEAIETRKKVIEQDELDKFLKRMLKKQPPPPKAKGMKPPIISEINQIGINPPTFALFLNKPERLIFSYRRYIQNNLRKQFKLEPSGLKLIVYKKSDKS